MKTKLTLSIDDKIIRKTKQEAKEKGISLSQLYEEKMTGGNKLPDKKRSAWRDLKQMLQQVKPIKTLSRKTERNRRLQYLLKKHG